MARKYWLGLLLLTTGCSGMNHTERGMLTGGALGAGAGTVIGGLSGRPGAGAAIGAAGGALLGGVVGNEHDKAEQRQIRAAHEYQMRNPPLSVQDVIQMSQQHISDRVIIDQMRATNSFYTLNSADITFLKQQGVSDGVVSTMISRRPGSVPVVVQPRPVGAVYVVEPPPPPVSVGVGFGWSSGPRRCWH
ncbi:MAG: glycine zipper domain-containing protein [Gemmataceae bacterium]|nr:glycine zipper domain-containing protein [Gemmataceae bacterium]MCI0741064.1 glycine zipper domain-containing protein [Gemmataceae bacterium]